MKPQFWVILTLVAPLAGVSVAQPTAPTTDPGVKTSPPAPPAATKSSPVSTPFFKPSTSTGGTSVLAPAFETVTETVVGTLALFNPSVSYSVQYGDGIPSVSGRRENSYVHQLNPSIRMNFAERLMLTYTPSFIWYSVDSLNDRVNHSASVNVGGTIEEWSVGLVQTYSYSATPLIETVEVTQEESWGSALSLSRPLGEKTSLDISLGRNARTTVRYNDVATWDGSGWLRYQYSPVLVVAAGSGAPGWVPRGPSSPRRRCRTETGPHGRGGPRLR